MCGMKCIFGGSACSRLQFTSSSWLGHREPSSVTTFTDRVCSTCGKSDFYHLKKQKIHVHFYHFKFNLPHFYRTLTLYVCGNCYCNWKLNLKHKLQLVTETVNCNANGLR